MQSGDPTFQRVVWESLSWQANPKSISLTQNWGVSMIFSGFISLWTMLRVRKQVKAFTKEPTTFRICLSSILRPAITPPSQCSMTMYRLLGVSYTFLNFIMLGWSSRLISLSSLNTFYRMSRRGIEFFQMILTAARWPSRWRARQTRAQVPLPRSRSKSTMYLSICLVDLISYFEQLINNGTLVENSELLFLSCHHRPQPLRAARLHVVLPSAHKAPSSVSIHPLFVRRTILAQVSSHLAHKTFREFEGAFEFALVKKVLTGSTPEADVDRDEGAFGEEVELAAVETAFSLLFLFLYLLNELLLSFKLLLHSPLLVLLTLGPLLLGVHHQRGVLHRPPHLLQLGLDALKAIRSHALISEPGLEALLFVLQLLEREVEPVGPLGGLLGVFFLDDFHFNFISHSNSRPANSTIPFFFERLHSHIYCSRSSPYTSSHSACSLRSPQMSLPPIFGEGRQKNQGSRSWAEWSLQRPRVGIKSWTAFASDSLYFTSFIILQSFCQGRFCHPQIFPGTFRSDDSIKFQLRQLSSRARLLADSSGLVRVAKRLRSLLILLLRSQKTILNVGLPVECCANVLMRSLTSQFQFQTDSCLSQSIFTIL